MIAFVLKECGRKIDLSTSASEQISDAPTIVIEANGDPKSIEEYQHHILIFSQLPSSEKESYSILADRTPKSGGIFFDDRDELAKSIAKKERADVTVIPFSLPKFEMQNGRAILINSNEKIPIQVSSTEDLMGVSATKELLSKIGITSSQFYKTISSFK